MNSVACSYCAKLGMVSNHLQCPVLLNMVCRICNERGHCASFCRYSENKDNNEKVVKKKYVSYANNRFALIYYDDESELEEGEVEEDREGINGEEINGEEINGEEEMKQPPFPIQMKKTNWADDVDDDFSYSFA